MDINMLKRTNSKTMKVFCCYARKDQQWLLELKTHLAPLQREGLITLWDDRNIYPGDEWECAIRCHLDTAQIILLLVSPNFMASHYCYGVEMLHAMELHECGKARVIPIILHPLFWQEAPFGKLQALPTSASPITSSDWRHPNEAFYSVVEGIRRVVVDRATNKCLSENRKRCDKIGEKQDRSRSQERTRGKLSYENRQDHAHF